MSKAERAKQFMPFDALKGLQEALRIKENEREIIERQELSENEAQEISNTLLGLASGDRVEVKYYSEGHILTVSGTAKLKYNDGKILVDDEEIYLLDLTGIKKV